jgi:hypothetical protein
MKHLFLMASALSTIGLGACSCGSIEVTLQGPPTATTADGMTPANVTAKVTYGGSTLNQGNFTFNTSLGSFVPFTAGCTTPTAQTTAPVVGGVGTVQLYSLTAGTADVTVEWQSSDCSGQTASGATEVVFSK